MPVTLCTCIALAGCGPTQMQKQTANVTQSSAAQQAGLSQVNQQALDSIAHNLSVNYRLVTNIPSEKCDKTKADGACFEVELSFTAGEAINAAGWQIYFSQISPVQSFESDDFIIEHINGDLHKISLQEDFTGFKQNETKTLLFRAQYWSLSEHDAIPNYILSADKLAPRIIESTRENIDPDTGLETLPFVTAFTDKEKQFKRSANDNTQWLNSKSLFDRNAALADSGQDVGTAIIPTPKHMQLDAGNGKLDIAKGLKLEFGNVNQHEVMVAVDRLASLGIKLSEQGVPVKLAVQANDSKKIGSYQLAVKSGEIRISGVDGNGVFNGLQSLASLFHLDKKNLPLLEIEDEPHYEFRGMLVDVARNFHSKAFILKLLDQMAAYKLNKLHLHLGDDEGWRLEIPGLPELTAVAANRCLDLQEEHCLLPQLGAGIEADTKVNGYYSVSDYQEILRAASARHIQVIPSLDMPGHSRAAVKAMAARYNKYTIAEDSEKASQFLLHDPQDKTRYSSVQFYNDNTINVCLESSYAFVKEVMTQVKAIHAEAGQPLTRYHIGADETAGAWVESQACKDFVTDKSNGVNSIKELAPYFVERVADILFDLGIEPAAWSDGLEHTRKENMPAVVQANAWGHLPWGSHKQTHELANRNWQVVISTPDVMYFDFPYEADPKEHGYYWASRATNTEKVFQFMPDNLPIHAEFWSDREDNPYSADDRLTKDETGKVLSAPLTPGRKFLGLQGQLWSETTRSDKMSEYKIFPRLLALAERAWYLPEWAIPYDYQGAKYSRDTQVFNDELRRKRDKAWSAFAQAVGRKELAKMELAQVHYRLPTVGAVIRQGVLYANIAFPGLAIEYSSSDGNWLDYNGPVKVSGDIRVRSRSHDGQRHGRTTKVAGDDKK